MKNRMNYINGLRVTLSTYAILTAEVRETTRIATARRMENANLIDCVLIVRGNDRRKYQKTALYELTRTGRQVADELRREAQRGE